MNDAAIPQHIERALSVIAEVAPGLARRLAAFAGASRERAPQPERAKEIVHGSEATVLAPTPAERETEQAQIDRELFERHLRWNAWRRA